MGNKINSAKEYFKTDHHYESRSNMFRVLDQKEEFILIGLTGRLGSGCSEFAKILSSDFDKVCNDMTWPTPGRAGFRDNGERELRILVRFAESHWQKFDIIRGRDIITSFLVDDFDTEKKDDKLNIHANDIFDKVKESVNIDTISINSREELNNYIKEYQSEIERINGSSIDLEKENGSNTIDEYIQNLYSLLTGEENENKNYDEIGCFFDKLYYSYIDKERFNSRRDTVQICDNILSDLSRERAKNIINSCTNFDSLLDRLKQINHQLKETSFCFDLFVYCTKILPTLSDAIKTVLGEDNYTKDYQGYGNLIRRYGSVSKNSNDNTNQGIFALPQRMNQYIKVIRHPFSKAHHRPVRIVIDSIKNPFEALYLRSRYAAFTLIAVSANESLRNKWRSKQEIKPQQLVLLDWNEYPDIGCKRYMEIYNHNMVNKKTTQEIKENKENIKKEILKDDEKLKNEFEYWETCDEIRSAAYIEGQHMFFLQDVGRCIEAADIYISNDIEEQVKHSLTISAVRTIMLLVFPGLVQPTPVERCMQIAYAAKHNSGCLSRQVGAVVTDDEYNILSLGWNDVPCGDISCSMKNLIDLCADQDCDAYTDYELHSLHFEEIKKSYNFNPSETRQILQGLPLRYCFKNLDKKEFKDPMRARAMHAEEKALNQCGERARGGFLFTTSSPCEMCSKNAKNHRISRIYYIEPYPGDAEQQYTKSGLYENRAQHILYTGAVGRAYTQMYSQIMPYKDMLKAIGAPDCFKVSKKGSETARQDHDENHQQIEDEVSAAGVEGKKETEMEQRTSERR